MEKEREPGASSRGGPFIFGLGKTQKCLRTVDTTGPLLPVIPAKGSGAGEGKGPKFETPFVTGQKRNAASQDALLPNIPAKERGEGEGKSENLKPLS